MRITGRQLRQIIKEEVARMMDDEINLNEDSGTAANAKRFNDDIAINGPLYKEFKSRMPNVFTRIYGANAPQIDKIVNAKGMNVPVKINIVLDVGGASPDVFAPLKITDMTFDGEKAAILPSMGELGNRPEFKKVSLDMMTEVTFGYGGGQPAGAETIRIKMAKAR
jgi:hypothetical protein